MQILKFERQNCAPCVAAQNFLDGQGVEVRRVPIETEPEVAMEYQIRSVPTTILLNDEGEEVKRIIGFSLDSFTELMELHAQG